MSQPKTVLFLSCQSSPQIPLEPAQLLIPSLLSGAPHLASLKEGQ